MSLFENRKNKNDVFDPGKVDVKIFDSDGKECEADDTGYLVTMDISHHKIHEGNHYFVKGYVEFGATDSIDFVMTTPATGQIHLLFQIEGTGETLVQVYENTAHSDDGTPVTVYNNNRQSSNTTSATVQSDPTVTGVGTLLASALFGVASNPSKTFGGDTRRDDELILKQSEDYLFRITSNSNNNNIDYRATWYEVS
jgi:hypothetical protein